MNSILIEPHYFPNIQFFSKFRQYETIIIDDTSFFEKQSYRNRASVLSANKVLDLIVPVKKGKSKLPVKEVEIDYSSKWQKEQFHSLKSAYNNSPFFLYYMDSFKFVFEKKQRFLFDLDMKIISVLTEIFDLHNPVRFLSQIKPGDFYYHNFINKIHPRQKTDDPGFHPKCYYQVFAGKFGFVPGLSAIDLLFNMGNESVDYLNYNK